MNSRSIFLCGILATLLAGCSTDPSGQKHSSSTAAERDGSVLGLFVPGKASPPAFRQGESVILIGEEPAALANLPRKDSPVAVRSTYQRDPAGTEYVEGQDFVVDYSTGTLRRTPASRIPDFRTNMLYGQQVFDHSKFPGFGNTHFFAFVDYTAAKKPHWPEQPPQTQFLKATKARLQAGQPLKIVAFGDSITAGGDVTKPEYLFWKRWADDLQKRHPASQITSVNGATGGDSTVQGLARLQTKVIDEKPDLVLIGFGMNDHNINSVTIPKFEENLQTLVNRIRAETKAEVVLFSAFPPNPKWKFGSHHMVDYAAATGRVAQQLSCAYADVFSNWVRISDRKKPEDLLGNNINHPNDFGHWVYFRVLQNLGL
jgi:lysophospholipase L1-like esterase